MASAPAVPGGAAAACTTSPGSASSSPPAQHRVCLVVAADERDGIGKNGALPWELPSDMTFFREVTSSTTESSRMNAVIMGRKTWASIPGKHRPLRKREESIPDDVLVATSLSEAIATLSTPEFASRLERVFVIGGAAAFTEALSSSSIVCDTVYLTRIFRGFDCDVFLAPIDDAKYALNSWKPRAEENGIPFQFCTYVNRAVYRLPRTPRPSAPIFTPPGEHEELQYLDAIRDILRTGVVRDDRTGVGTISKFGMQLRFSLGEDVLPLLTTKRVFWRGVAEELLWFISGNTSAKALRDKGVHIWDGNGSREFLDRVGLSHREEGDLGPVYGFQWRHFGAEYKDMHTDYTGEGVDQLAEVIHKIKTNPMDRRIILSAWNPAALSQMALPPCHMFAQFYVHDGELSCQMYQRSGDMGLGVPFNIASYALLTRLIAHVTGLKAGEFVHVIGDAHVYKNHVEPLMQQLERTPRAFPKLRLDASITRMEDFRYEHLTVEGYDPHPTIKMDMAV